MLCRLRRTLRRLRKDRRGSVSTMVLTMVPAMISLAGVSEFAAIHAMKARLQSTADAAVVAAIQSMPDYVNAQNVGRTYGEKNMPPADHGTVIPNANVVRGTWDAVAMTFTADGGGTDLKVTAERSVANGNPLPLRFISLFTGNTIDVAASAVARTISSGGPVDDCFSHGIVADGDIDVLSHADVSVALCLYSGASITIGGHVETTSDSVFYGANGVSVGPFNRFEPDVKIVMPDLADYAPGFFTFGTPPTLEEREMTIVGDVDPADTLASVLDGSYAMPDYLSGITSSSKKEAKNAPQMGTRYNLSGNVTVKGVAVNQVAMVVNGNVTIKSYANLKDALIVATGDILIEAHQTMGDDFCNTGSGVTLVAGGSVTLEAHHTISGLKVEAVDDLTVGAHMSGEALSARVKGAATFEANASISPCSNGRTPAGTEGESQTVLAQ